MNKNKSYFKDIVYNVNDALTKSSKNDINNDVGFIE